MPIKVGLFAAKFNKDNIYFNNPKPFIEDSKKSILEKNMFPILSYFDTTCDEDKKDLKVLYSKVEKILQDSDIIIVENTSYSQGISFILGRTIELRKPILVLFDKDNDKNLLPSNTIRAYEHYSRYFYKEYTHDILENIVSDFLTKAKSLLNVKLIFSFPSAKVKYLQWASKEYKRPMVDIMRELLDKAMEEDDSWKESNKK